MAIDAIERAGQAALPDSAPPISSRSPSPDPPTEGPKPLKLAGFAAGILSGWTKLIIGHPFDTIKTRLQCAPPTMYRGAVDCFVQTVTTEGPRKLYAGAMVPALGWSLTDGILMGSLDNYRSFLLRQSFFREIDPSSPRYLVESDGEQKMRLSLAGHGLAGMWAGWTNAWVAHPVELIKSKLQLQYTMDAAKKFGPSSSTVLSTTASPAASHLASQQIRTYSTTSAGVQDEFLKRETFKNPWDVVRQVVKNQGVFGMWRGFSASLIYRSSFAFMFGGFEFFNRQFDKLKGTSWEMSKPTANFVAGGMASNLYWATALPFDNVKNRVMVDGLSHPRYTGVWHAFQTILHEKDSVNRSKLGNLLMGGKNFYRGVIPVVLRAFPTNAAALAVWEAVMRAMHEK